MVHLSNTFPELFRREAYAVTLALNEQQQVQSTLDDVLATREIEGLWDKDYSLVPMGELEGRDEGEPIAQKNMSMGYTTYGAIAIEMSGKVGLSNILKQRSREFTAQDGGVNEPKFAGYLADSVVRQFTLRDAQKRRKLAAKIFNYGGIQAGHSFFNQYVRSKSSDVTNSNLIYDGSPLFAYPAAAHASFASGAVAGPGSSAVGTTVDYTGLLADTGGYFNAFNLPPAYWSLKRVWTHFVNNMQYDDNDEDTEIMPDTLLVSSHNYIKWTEILKSKFVEPTTDGNQTNIENVFYMEGFKLKLVPCRDLIKNTWFLGVSKSRGISICKAAGEDDPWAYWRNEEDRTYWTSFERYWGMWIQNWRYWCAGAISTDGTTAPTFGGTAEADWDTIPSGV